MKYIKLFGIVFIMFFISIVNVNARTNNISSVNGINSKLSNFYNLLERKNYIVKSTEASLITTAEYNSSFDEEGTSFLLSANPFFATDGTNIKNIKSAAITPQTGQTTDDSGIRAKVTLKESVRVIGEGSKWNPFIIVDSSDINIIEYTLNSEHKLRRFPSKYDTDSVGKYYSSASDYEINVECRVSSQTEDEAHVEAEWDYENWGIKIKSTTGFPINCGVDFKTLTE